MSGKSSVQVLIIGVQVHNNTQFWIGKHLYRLHTGAAPRKPSNHTLSFTCEDTSLFQGKTVILFDDVVTTGSTYKAAKNVLLANLDNIKIVGLFISRSIVDVSY